VLRGIAQGNSASLPRILPRLRYIFDWLGRGEDAAWCQWELHGYSADETPKYRYAEVTVDWSPVGGVVSMNTMTGHISGQPPERVVSIPLGSPVEELLQISLRGQRRATGNTQPGLMHPWREVEEISPEVVQGVLRRIMDESYRRALAAKTTETA
jgi:hypothetical protein